ncbi:annexin, partial [Elysia marginata]
FEQDLEEALCSDTSGYFRRLLVSLLTAGREPDEGVDYGRAEEDAKKFFEAGEARWGTEEAELNAILCLRSRSQLAATFYEFEKLADKTIEESIKDECGGDLQEGYLAIVVVVVVVLVVVAVVVVVVAIAAVALTTTTTIS